MAEPYQQPHCPHCGEDFTQLGMWLDAQERCVIFFCMQCGNALGAQVLRPLPPEEGFQGGG